MKTFLFIALLVAAFATAAQAQTVQVDINRATLLWTWTQDPIGGNADEFRVKCGNVSGTYNRTTAVGPTLREVAIKSAIGGPGNWFCVVAAANAFGESGVSNEVPFAAGAAPVGNLGLQVRAQ